MERNLRPGALAEQLALHVGVTAELTCNVVQPGAFLGLRLDHQHGRVGPELARQKRELAGVGADVEDAAGAHPLVVHEVQAKRHAVAQMQGAEMLEHGPIQGHGRLEPASAHEHGAEHFERLGIFHVVGQHLTAELLAKPANSAETEALLIGLRAQKTARASLPPEAFSEDPTESGFVVGHIGDRPLKMSEFTGWLVETHGRPHAETYRKTLIIERLADELGASFTREEITLRREQDLDARLELFHEDDRVRWLETLTTNGRTLAGWRREANIKALHDLRAEMLYYSQRTVTDDEVHAEWEARYGKNGRAHTVRWILLTPPPPPAELQGDGVQAWLDKELKALAVKADELRRRVIEGGEDFATLARRYSADTSTRSDGGRFPGVFELDQQHETVAKAVASLRAGEVSRPIRLLAGCSIYQLQKIVVTPFNEVEAELREELMTRRPSAVELVGFINQLCARER